MVTPERREREKKLQRDPSRTEDTLLDPSGQPRQKNLPLSFLKEERGGGGGKTEFNYTVENHSLPSGSDISTI